MIDLTGSEDMESMRLATNVLETAKSILRSSRIEPAKIRAERSTIPSFSFLCSLTSLFRYRAAHRFQHFFHFGIFGPIFRGRQGVLPLPFDVDYLAHGPPRGRAAALT